MARKRRVREPALLAAQCERLGVTLVSEIAQDFRRLRRFLKVEVIAPFPAR